MGSLNRREKHPEERTVIDMTAILFLLNLVSLSVSWGTPRMATAVIAALIAAPALPAMVKNRRNINSLSSLYVAPIMASGLVALALSIEGGL